MDQGTKDVQIKHILASFLKVDPLWSQRVKYMCQRRRLFRKCHAPCLKLSLIFYVKD